MEKDRSQSMQDFARNLKDFALLPREWWAVAEEAGKPCLVASTAPRKLCFCMYVSTPVFQQACADYLLQVRQCHQSCGHQNQTWHIPPLSERQSNENYRSVNKGYCSINIYGVLMWCPLKASAWAPGQSGWALTWPAEGLATLSKPSVPRWAPEVLDTASDHGNCSNQEDKELTTFYPLGKERAMKILEMKFHASWDRCRRVRWGVEWSVTHEGSRKSA